MKILYIDINNEKVKSKNNLIVCRYDHLLSDFYFHLGCKIVRECVVKSKTALIKEFGTTEYKDDFKCITTQWNDLKRLLFGETIDGTFSFMIPESFIYWLKFSPQYVSVYDKNFSHGESDIISIDLKELYEDTIVDLEKNIIQQLQKEDVKQIVINDYNVTQNSFFIQEIKKKIDIEFILYDDYRQYVESEIKEIEAQKLKERLEKERLENEKRREKQLKRKQEEKDWLEKPFIQSIEEFFFFQLVSNKTTCNLPQKQILKGIRYFLNKTNKDIIIPNGINDPCSPFFKREYRIEVTNRDKGYLKLFFKLSELIDSSNDELMKEIYDNLYKIKLSDGVNTVKIPSIGGFNGRTKSYLETQWHIKVLKDESLEIKRIF